MKKDLSIITINFNTYDLVKNCIESIIKNTRDISYEIIIINNHPITKKIDAKNLKNLFSELDNIKVIKSQNNGFGSGNNLGAKKAEGKYLIFLNSDTLITDNSLNIMVKYFERNTRIGALDPLLYTKKGVLQKHFYKNFQNLKILITRNDKIKKINLRTEFFSADMVTGAAMMVRKDLFDKLGGFDDHFFMYFEDEDLCRRLSNLKKINGILTTAKIIHLEGKSSGHQSKKKMYYHSQNYYWQKHYGYFMMLLMRLLRFPYILWQKGKND